MWLVSLAGEPLALTAPASVPLASLAFRVRSRQVTEPSVNMSGNCFNFSGLGKHSNNKCARSRASALEPSRGKNQKPGGVDRKTPVEISPFSKVKLHSTWTPLIHRPGGSCLEAVFGVKAWAGAWGLRVRARLGFNRPFEGAATWGLHERGVPQTDLFVCLEKPAQRL